MKPLLYHLLKKGLLGIGFPSSAIICCKLKESMPSENCANNTLNAEVTRRNTHIYRYTCSKQYNNYLLTMARSGGPPFSLGL